MNNDTNHPEGTATMKPYVSLLDGNWEVLNASGKVVFTSRHPLAATRYLNKHWARLSRATKN